MKFLVNVKMNYMKKVLFFFLCSFFTLGAFAQEITLQGVVTAANDGQPLPGVSVVVKGTTTGTVTNFDGNISCRLILMLY
jgi:TonB-dependent starch-binding outer membrane protein SusC